MFRSCFLRHHCSNGPPCSRPIRELKYAPATSNSVDVVDPGVAPALERPRLPTDLFQVTPRMTPQASQAEIFQVDGCKGTNLSAVIMLTFPPCILPNVSQTVFKIPTVSIQTRMRD